MKKISVTLFALLFIAASFKVSAQTEQTRQVSGFNGILLSGSFNVHVKIDGTESLKISADENIINDIQTVVEDGKLRIGFKNSFTSWHRNVGKVDVYITAKALSSLSDSGSGTIKVDGELRGNDVIVHISGSGNITTAVKSETILAHISGSGSTNLSGSSTDATIEISGSGEVKAKELKTGTVKVHLSGSGNAYVNADKTLSAHISGSGNLLYSGSASVTDIHTSGSGRIRKENE
jgi:hypothetical protein